MVLSGRLQLIENYLPSPIAREYRVFFNLEPMAIGVGMARLYMISQKRLGRFQLNLHGCNKGGGGHDEVLIWITGVSRGVSEFGR